MMIMEIITMFNPCASQHPHTSAKSDNLRNKGSEEAMTDNQASSTRSSHLAVAASDSMGETPGTVPQQPWDKGAGIGKEEKASEDIANATQLGLGRANAPIFEGPSLESLPRRSGSSFGL